MKTKTHKPVIPIISCLVVQLCAGIIYLWSVFRTAVTHSYFWTPDASTMVAPLMLFGFTIGNFVGGIINDKKGPRAAIIPGVVCFALGIALTGLIPRGAVLFGSTGSAFLIYPFYCLLGGIGAGMSSGACISCIQKWMPDHCGLATGLAASAFGLSNVVFAPFSRFLMKCFTVAETGLVDFTAVFLIMAAIFSALGFGACAFIRLPPWETDKKAVAASLPADAPGLPLPKAMKTKTFWFIFAALFFYNGTWNLASPIVYDLGLDRNLTPALATLCVSITGIGNASGRLIMGTVSDRLGRIPTTLLLCFITLVAALCMVFARGIPYLATVFLIAFTYGGPAALFPAMTSDFFGRNNYGMNYGFLIQGLGLSSIFFNLMSTRLLRSAPVPTFLMAAASAIAAIIPLYLIFRIQRHQKVS